MLKLRLSRYEFLENEYGRVVTFRIYDESDAVFDCDSYSSVEVLVTDEDGNEVLDQLTQAWTDQSTGVGTFAFNSTKLLSVAGSYFVQVILEKTGEETPTELIRITVLPSGVKT